MIEGKRFEKIMIRFKDEFPTIDLSFNDGCVFLDGQLNDYEQIVAAGYLAARFKSEGVVNRIKLSGYTEPKMRTAPFIDKKYDGQRCDVLIIGAGIIGCAIARELSKYNLSAIVVEKENDVALHASSRNDGVIHIGIDLKTSTLKHHYLRKSVPLYQKMCEELHVPYINRGQLVLFPQRSLRPLMFLFNRMAKKRHIQPGEVWNRKRLLEEEPNIGKAARYGMFFPEGATICPYETVIALAEHAIENGVRFFLDTAVLDMVVDNNYITKVITNRGDIYPRYVVNAAGTFSDRIAAMAHDQTFTIHPRKGIEAILDKKAKSRAASRSVSMYRGSSERKKDHTKGGGIIPTVDGNVLIGPTAYETPERENYETDADSINALFVKHHDTLPHLKQSDVITYFAGIRAATYEEDFVIKTGKWTKNIIHAAGIQSPGLTAAPAIAIDIAKFIEQLEKAPLPVNINYQPQRRVQQPLAKLDDAIRDQMIKDNPNFGQIVCRCEEISKGEIIATLHRPLIVPTLDGIKRRVRAGMGRCQGGFCGPLVTQIIHEELQIPYRDIYKKGYGPIILKMTKDETYDAL
jgi:glycerol-3-phosphate dehydrogenase